LFCLPSTFLQPSFHLLLTHTVHLIFAFLLPYLRLSFTLFLPPFTFLLPFIHLPLTCPSFNSYPYFSPYFRQPFI
jgi:hypothetical protein